MSRFVEFSERVSRFPAIFDGAAIGLALTDADGHMVESNTALQKMLGYSQDQLRTLTSADYTHAEDLAIDRNLYLELTAGTRAFYQVEKRFVREDVHVIWVRLHVSLLGDGAEYGPLAIVVVEDVTDGTRAAAQIQGRMSKLVHTAAERTQQLRLVRSQHAALTDVLSRERGEHQTTEDQLRHQTLHDSLTGLPNRTLLLDRLKQGLSVSRRESTPLVLMLIDLDGFKNINDAYGHGVGDAVLTQISQRFLGAVRESDTVARLSGDEFVIVLPGTDVPTALVVARRLHSALVAPFLLDGRSLEVAMSIGLALSPQHGRKATTLLRAADRAMYHVKGDVDAVCHTILADLDLSLGVTAEGTETAIA